MPECFAKGLFKETQAWSHSTPRTSDGMQGLLWRSKTNRTLYRAMLYTIRVSEKKSASFSGTEFDLPIQATLFPAKVLHGMLQCQD